METHAVTEVFNQFAKQYSFGIVMVVVIGLALCRLLWITPKDNATKD